MAKKIIIAVLFIFNLSCLGKDEQNRIKNKNIDAKKEIVKKGINDSISLKDDCSKKIIDLIKSSNIKNPFKDNLQIEIINNNGVNMRLRLFDKDDKLENTVGWIIFDAENMRLLDITNDPENPIKLKFEEKIWNEIIKCSFNNNLSYCFDQTNNKKKENCITIYQDIETIEKCIFKNASLESIYDNLILNETVNGYKYLCKIIPKSNKVIEVNRDGIINIEYKIVSIDNMQLLINYEGGVTKIALQKVNNSVKQVTTYSSD